VCPPPEVPEAGRVLLVLDWSLGFGWGFSCLGFRFSRLGSRVAWGSLVAWNPLLISCSSEGRSKVPPPADFFSFFIFKKLSLLFHNKTNY
jgi:hypothetical protein